MITAVTNALRGCPEEGTDGIISQCGIIPKDHDIIHVTLIIINVSGPPITNVEPGDLEIEGDWTADRIPNGVNELPTGHTLRFFWILVGSGDVPLITASATFSDPSGTNKNTGPVPCQ